MELNTPRHNPYSEEERIRKKLSKDGYKHEFTVIDENSCRDEDGSTYSTEDLVINDIFRIIDKDVKSKSTTLYALASKNGAKGLIVTPYADQDDVTEKFLLNTDKSEDTKNNY